MHTEMIDKLFLELSQITTAETEKEIQLKKLLNQVLKAWKKDGVSGEQGHYLLFNRACLNCNYIEEEDNNG